MASTIERFSTEYDRKYALYPRRMYHSGDKLDSDFAGKLSQKMHIAQEPPIQRKRRINAPYTSDHVKLGFDSSETPADDEYMLLGEKNERFSANVPYRNPQRQYPRRPMTAPSHKLRGNRGDNYQYDEISTPETPRLEKQQQRPFTADPRRRRRISPPHNQRGKYYKPNRRSKSQAARIKDEGVQTKNSYNLEQALRSSATKGVLSNNYGNYDPSYYDIYQRTKTENGRDNSQPQVRKKERLKEHVNYRSQGIRNDSELKMKAKNRAKRSPSPQKWLPADYYMKDGQIRGDRNRLDNELKKDVEQYRRRNKGEHVNEMDEYYAKRYELGLAENRPKPIQRLSEYQTQYDKKLTFYEKPFQNSSTINNSYLDQPKYLARPMSTTEYQRQFSAQPIPRSRSLSPGLYKRQGVQQNAEPRVTKSKHYRSRTANPAGRQERSVSPPPRLVIGSNEYTPATALNPQRMSFPLGPRKTRLSEYRASFKDHFQPEDIHHRKNEVEENKYENKENNSNWYQQIGELRKKAEQYKIRARGTHFSREHTAQLMSQNNRYWDPPSTESSRNAIKMNGDFSKSAQRSGSVTPHTLSDDDSEEERPSTPVFKESIKERNGRTTSHTGLLNSNKTTGVGRKMQNSQSMSRKASLFDGSAGKPSYDPHYILDEGASHDTPINSRSRSKTMSRGKSSLKPQANRNSIPKAFEDSDSSDPKRHENLRLNGLLENSSPRSNLSWSIRSLASTSSLASETLDKARKRQNTFWNE